MTWSKQKGARFGFFFTCAAFAVDVPLVKFQVGWIYVCIHGEEVHTVICEMSLPPKTLFLVI